MTTNRPSSSSTAYPIICPVCAQPHLTTNAADRGRAILCPACSLVARAVPQAVADAGTLRGLADDLDALALEADALEVAEPIRLDAIKLRVIAIRAEAGAEVYASAWIDGARAMLGSYRAQLEAEAAA